MKKEIVLLSYGIIFIVFTLTSSAICEYNEGVYNWGTYGECDTLVKDIDYTIDYNTGTVMLLNDNVSNFTLDASYNINGDLYVDDPNSRVIMRLIPVFFVLTVVFGVLTKLNLIKLNF